MGGMTMWFAKSTKGYLWPRRRKKLKEPIDKDIDGYTKSKDESSSVNGEGRKTGSKDDLK